VSRLRERLQNVTGGEAATPLLILFGLNFVDEFDRIAFAALTPEIRDAFDLTDAGIGAVGITAAVFYLMAALPMGFLADRRSRVKLSAVAALLWGVASVLTGIVPAVFLLFLVRLMADRKSVV
jgi:sugar phosphate permease